MRQQQAVQAQLTLVGAHLHPPQDLHTTLADGDTLHLWAQATLDASGQDLTGCPQLQASLQLHTADAPRTLMASRVLWDELGDLSRICAAQEARLLPDEARQAVLAQHQVIEADLRHMAASVTAAPAAPHVAAAIASSVSTLAPAVVQAPATATPAVSPQPPRHHDLAGWLSEPQAPGNPLASLVQHFNAQAGSYTQFRAALTATLRQVNSRFLDKLVMSLIPQAGNPGRVWAMLMYWLHAEHELTLRPQALELVQRELASLPISVRTQVQAALDSEAQPTAQRHVA